ncbi:hypothetical protein GMRT_10155 [Giardia muris]|uniref:Uncharacterized protein n=1 Tax=Giardia muris TaxID=5742 RepID=A0A4Z1SM65_GIAMU|nr:hypothetical protein GMRT_10155 [Giardia muris]|eukprot:TNJ26776.1 hypothetical protein GMRT_10155 [Giardia muris]
MCSGLGLSSAPSFKLEEFLSYLTPGPSRTTPGPKPPSLPTQIIDADSWNRLRTSFLESCSTHLLLATDPKSYPLETSSVVLFTYSATLTENVIYASALHVAGRLGVPAVCCYLGSRVPVRGLASFLDTNYRMCLIPLDIDAYGGRLKDVVLHILWYLSARVALVELPPEIRSAETKAGAGLTDFQELVLSLQQFLPTTALLTVLPFPVRVQGATPDIAVYLTGNLPYATRSFHTLRPPQPIDPRLRTAIGALAAFPAVFPFFRKHRRLIASYIIPEGRNTLSLTGSSVAHRSLETFLTDVVAEALALARYPQRCSVPPLVPSSRYGYESLIQETITLLSAGPMALDKEKLFAMGPRAVQRPLQCVLVATLLGIVSLDAFLMIAGIPVAKGLADGFLEVYGTWLRGSTDSGPVLVKEIPDLLYDACFEAQPVTFYQQISRIDTRRMPFVYPHNAHAVLDETAVAALQLSLLLSFGTPASLKRFLTHLFLTSFRYKLPGLTAPMPILGRQYLSYISVIRILLPVLGKNYRKPYYFFALNVAKELIEASTAGVART